MVYLTTKSKNSLAYLQLVPQLEVEDFHSGPLVVPSTHLVDVGGLPCVRHPQNLIGQSPNKRDRCIHSFKARDGDGGGLVH